jgi:hypothetical protein
MMKCDGCQLKMGDVLPIQLRMQGKATVYQSTVRFYCGKCRVRSIGRYRLVNKGPR